jgi:hypothetical protein
MNPPPAVRAHGVRRVVAPDSEIVEASTDRAHAVGEFAGDSESGD